MLEVLSQTVEQAERDEAFHHVAEARWTNLLATGETVPWDDARAWLEARSRGEHTRRPAVRTPKR